MKSLWLYLGLACIATHELDAVTHEEWRLLYVLRALPPELARDAFVALHVPLFAGLIWLTHHPNPRWREAMRGVLMAFLVVHLGLHWRLSTHPLYTFHTALSWSLIVGGAASGLAYLLLVRRRR
jgi:apolipoprotein N-acyltransferase